MSSWKDWYKTSFLSNNMKYKKKSVDPKLEPTVDRYNNSPVGQNSKSKSSKQTEENIDQLDEEDPNKKQKCQKCGKVFIVFANITFGFIGVCILAGGIILITGINVYGSSLTTDGTLGYIAKLGPMANITNSSATDEQKNGLKADMSVLTQEVSYGLIAIGGILLLMAIFGCIIFCCDDVMMAVCYGGLLAVVILGQLVILIVFSTGLINSSLRAKMNDTLQTKYTSADKYSGISVTWNFFMLEFGCCGVDNYYDFQNSSSWLSIRKYETSSNGSVFTYYDRLKTPLACCQFNDKIPAATDYKGGRTGATPNCAKTPDSTNSNFENGCWKSVSDLMSKYKIIILAVTCVVIVLQIVLLVITLLLFRRKLKQAEAEKAAENGGVIDEQ